MTRYVIIIKKVLKRILSGNFRRSIPLPGRVKWGDLNRTEPFSTEFGIDRGGAIDRYYIERFLEQNSYAIKGQVLEIGDNEYTLRFGGSKIQRSDILDIDETNLKANYISDLSNAPMIPDDTFDCIILTQTLHIIYDCKAALATCKRILKPGGVLLLTVPGISQIYHSDYYKSKWMWAFTGIAVKRMLAELFSAEYIKTDVYGNVLVAAAFLYGMGLPELKKSQLDRNDPHYQLIITATAIK
jgi:SAM-dependent methyltransferase